jgi:ATP-dependent Clp protease ATP-binding subunit ClpA
MKTTVIPIRTRSAERMEDLSTRLRRQIVGQQDALDAIVPYVELFEAGLSPEGRPVGVFLLLGPTGTGKTRTVEALAEALHGSEKSILRIDCGEFQLDHEVAKLIGAPPGYLGHRETQPMVSQHKLNSVTSERSSISIVLLDEVEKAAPSLARILLGVLDKASLKLGDNTTVNFERSMIFMTSNLGAREMMAELRDRFGLSALTAGPVPAQKLVSIGKRALQKRFSPEFVNRIDETITYQPLESDAMARILDLQLERLERHLVQRLGTSSFGLQLTAEAREFLLERGTSPAYGARELKRVLHRHLIQPLARLVLERTVPAGSIVRVGRRGEGLSFQTQTQSRGVIHENAA